jgi:hypothetical protein
MRLQRPSFANVVSLIALFVALGGTSFAVVKLPKNSVRAKQIAPGAVGSSEVKDRSLLSKDFKPGQLPVGVRGATGPQGPQGTPGVSRGFQGAGSSGNVGSSLFGTTVAKLAVPPGKYFVTTNYEADTADGVAGSIQCRLINGVGGAGSSAIARDQTIAVGATENITMSGLFAVTPGQNMELQCSRSGASALVRVVEANIAAVQVSDFSGEAGP